MTAATPRMSEIPSAATTSMSRKKRNIPIFPDGSIQQQQDTCHQHLACPLCFERYDDEKHLPMTSCKCWHAICRECVLSTHILPPSNNSKVKCPMCRSEGAFSDRTTHFIVKDLACALRASQETNTRLVRRNKLITSTQSNKRKNNDETLKFFKGQVRDLQAKNSKLTGTILELEKKKSEEAQNQLFESKSKMQDMLERFEEIRVWLCSVDVALRVGGLACCSLDMFEMMLTGLLLVVSAAAACYFSTLI
jgi:hypothetical protein